MHPDFPAGDLVETIGEFVQCDVDGAVDVRFVELVRLPHIEDGDLLLVASAGESGEIGDTIGTQFGAGDEGVDLAHCCTFEIVDADADEFATRVEYLLLTLSDQGQRRSPGVEPAQIGYERTG